MNLNELLNRLQSSIQPGPNGGRLVLDGALLPEAGELASYFGLDRIVLDRVAVAPAAFAEVRLDGTARVLSAEQDVTLTGRVSGGAVQLLWTGRIPDPSWKLTQSFPGLPDYRGTVGAFLRPKPSFFGDLAIRDAAFVAATYDDPPARIQRGLGLTGRLLVQGPLTTLGPLAAGRSELPLSGSVRLRPAAGPLLELRAEIPGGGISLGEVGLQALEIRLQTVEFVDEEGVRQYESRIALQGLLEIGSIRVTLRHTLLQGDQRRVFSAVLEPGTVRLGSLADLASLVGGSADDFALPAELDSLATLYLAELGVCVDLEDRAVDYVTVTIASPETWSPPIPNLRITGLTLNWLFISPLDRAARAVEAMVSGKLLLGRAQPVELDVQALLPGFQIEAELEEGSTLPVTETIEHFLGSAGPLPDLVLEELRMRFDPKGQIFVVEGEIALSWEIDLAVVQLELQRLGLEITAKPGDLSGRIFALTSLAGQQFLVSAENPPTGGWIFSGELLPGSALDLASAVESLLGLSDDTLPAIPLEGIAFSFDTGSKEYRLEGRTAGFWQLRVTDDFLLQIRAAVQLERSAAGRLSGALTGELRIDDFRVLATYAFSPQGKALIFEIDYRGLRLRAAVRQVAGRTRLEIQLGDVDLIEVFRYLADAAVPGLEVELEPPWDLLGGLRLTGLTLVVDLTEKSVGFQTAVGRSFGFVSIDTVGLLYQRRAGRPAIDVQITGNFLGVGFTADRPLSWDLLKGQAPTVPGQGSGLLDLRYLAVGQRVALTSTAGLDNVTGAIARLRDAMRPIDEGTTPLAQLPGLRFDRDSHWLIAFDLTVLGTVRLSIVFNDPYLYGLLLRLAGPRAGGLAGLSFEILYKKVTDDIGVYKVELQLPDAFRRIELGAISLILPVVALDIYTNGNFKVDLGFPRNRDFTRSGAAQLLPFVGYGGLYFASLTGATSERVPVITNGEFHPVLEFGVGIAVGLGKDFRRGPLKAGLTITVEAILEGAIAWFHPYDAAVPSDRYHWVQGTLALVGHLWGEVDFGILSVSIDVVVFASATFVIEAYEPILIQLAVGVSVRASIKILFVRIRFSFSITLRESFTLGSKGTPPWIAAAAGAPRRAAAFQAFSVLPAALDWTPVAVFPSPRTVAFTLLPAFTGTADGPRGELLLAVESPESFAGLVEALLAWAIHARLGRLTGSIRREEVDQIHQDLQAPAAEQPGFTYATLLEFLGKNLRFRIGLPQSAAGEESENAAVFPMLPELAYRTAEQGRRWFREHNPVDDAYARRVSDYFRQLSVAFAEEEAAAPAALLAALPESVSTVIFRDALLLLARSAAGAAADLLASREEGSPEIEIAQLLADLREPERSGNLGAMLSRFLLHGLQLPVPDDPADTLAPLYELTGQQFPVPAPGAPLAVTVENAGGLPWIELAAGAELTLTLTAEELAAELPAEPIGIPVTGPAALPLAEEVPLRFTLARRLRWQSAEIPALLAGAGGPVAAQPSLWLLPQDLLARLDRDGGKEFELRVGRQEGAAMTTAPVASWAWAAVVELKLRRVSPAAGTLLPDLYLLQGADQNGRERLLELWQADGDGLELHLLYPPTAVGGVPGALASDRIDRAGTFLLKTNFSTLTTSGAGLGLLAAAEPEPAGPGWAGLGAPGPFLRLLWEASITGTGGFYLRYREADGGAGLPGPAFTDSGEGSLWLVALTADRRLRPFHNAAAVGDDLDAAAVNLFAQEPEGRGERTKIASVPPGHVGFQLSRPAVRLEGAVTTPEERAASLYSLLAFRLLDSGSFRESREGLPVGPLSPDSDTLWTYRKVVPAFRFAKVGPLPARAGLPPPEGNPYAGSGTAATLRFGFRDVFGHRAPTEPLPDLTVPVGYTDDLIGVANWPAVAGSYVFRPAGSGESGPTLEIRLDFDVDAAPDPDTAAAQARRYRQIYYQVMAEDVSFSLRSFARPLAGVSIPKAGIADLAAAAYVFLQADPDSPRVPPAPVVLSIPLHPESGSEPIFEVTVELEMTRAAGRVHPDFAGVEKVFRHRTLLTPRAMPRAAGTGDALALEDFARQFEAAFPALRVATGGRRAVGEDPRASRPVWAVRFAPGGFSGFAIDSGDPAFFALRPLANRPVSASEVPVRSYASGSGFGPATPHSFQAVDLEVWGRDFLAALEGFLAPEAAVAAFRSAPAAFEAVAGAKQALADAIQLGVEPILDGALAAGQLAAAREAIRQRLLIHLADGYATDTLIQYRTSVSSPFPDAARAPRLSGRPVSRTFAVLPEDGLVSVAARFAVSPRHLAVVLARQGKILRLGLSVSLPERPAETIRAGDTLETLAGRLGVPVPDLAELSPAGGLFAPEAVLPLTGLHRSATEADTLDSLAGHFAASVSTLAEANQDAKGIFRVGAVLQVGDRPPVQVTVKNNTLRQLAAAFPDLTPATLAEALRSVPALVAPGFTARAVELIPEHSLATAKTALADGGSFLTFLLDVQADAERRKLFLDLDYRVNELEFEIADVAGVEGYQASSWLSFLLPFGGTALGLAEVPLPLRASPLPPTLVAQEGTAAFASPATVQQAKDWSYAFSYQHQDAAQDTTFLRVVFNDDGAAVDGGPGGAPADGLFAALAEFTTVWPALGADLARLRQPGGDGDPVSRTAAGAFADLASRVAAAWDEHWRPRAFRSLFATDVKQIFEYRLTRTLRPGSEPPELETLVLTALSGRSGPAGRFPEAAWIDASKQAHALVKEGETAEECVYRYLEAVPAFARLEQRFAFPGLDVVAFQNASGGLHVTRNAELVSAGPTREMFVYRTPFVQFANPILPLFAHDGLLPLRQGAETLESSLARLFRELADAEGSPLPLVIQVAARYGYELVPGVGGAEPIVSFLPILFRPRFVPPETFAAQLAEALRAWEQSRNPSRQGGLYLFDVGVFSSLDAAIPWPLLELTGLVWRLEPA